MIGPADSGLGHRRLDRSFGDADDADARTFDGGHHILELGPATLQMDEEHAFGRPVLGSLNTRKAPDRIEHRLSPSG